MASSIQSAAKDRLAKMAAKRKVSASYNTPDAKQAQWTIAKARQIFPERVRNHIAEQKAGK